MQIVDIKQLCFQYFDNEILKNINISIDEGDIVLLVGANGAGKSTLLRVIAGMHLSSNYEKFNVLGSNCPQNQFRGLSYLGKKWQRSISFTGVSPYMADIKVRDMMKTWQTNNTERRDELVDVLNINLDWKMHQVSDGQRKRVRIMLGLLNPFKLLLIDEFLNELDIVIRDRFFRYLKKECALRNASVIYATHIFDNLDELVNKVIYISNGKCSKKQNILDFKNKDTLFNSVKRLVSLDYHNNKEDIVSINPIMFGPQFGYGSGRSNMLFNK